MGTGSSSRSRSIPACAGEPPPSPSIPCPRRVYPRVCGGTFAVRWLGRAWPGLSPRVRGNHRGGPGGHPVRGSIPACAGEPPPSPSRACPGRVYPRVCGGTRDERRDGALGQGLSPRVRGNRYRPAPGRACRGSIPACAGEPTTRSSGCRSRRVYPRVCGGTHHDAVADRGQVGLSPRVRGNLVTTGVADHADGSIPACAGEPSSGRPGPRWRRVYPRVCGGTRIAAPSHTFENGLSPRVRGNRTDAVGDERPEGSIPACAGEPRRNQFLHSLHWVYPRVCGGTVGHPDAHRAGPGLSPRVRGNPRWRNRVSIEERSIPACAGEPGSSGAPCSPCRVYPRVCGGTPNHTLLQQAPAGLSPRVRGNPVCVESLVRYLGSIPACAGEPGGGEGQAGPHGVYPRVCGGTVVGGKTEAVKWGLSPRVRGNPGGGGDEAPRLRSIPACAGEPAPCCSPVPRPRVYPRVCGGTPAADPPRPVAEGSIPACAGECAFR